MFEHVSELRGPQYYGGRALRDYVGGFARAKVLVIGDIIRDEYIWGNVSRISPEAPVPVVDVKGETKMLGGAANVIRNMVTLGASPLLCGVIGDDPTGKEILKEMALMDLTLDGVLTEPERPTSIKTRIVAHNQQVVRFDRESRRDISSGSMQKILDFVEGKIDGLDVMVVSDYGKGVISTPLMKELKRLVRSGTERSLVIAVDPKTGNFEHYEGVDVITPNHHEAGAFCGFEIIDEETLIQAGRQMLDKLNCRSVLITQGKQGMTLFENNGRMTHIPTVAKEVYDVTGAGDTVIATFSLGLASGLDLKSAAIISNFAAGIVVGQVGTSAVSAEELKKAIQE